MVPFESKKHAGLRVISYAGNNIFPPIIDVESVSIESDVQYQRIQNILKNQEYYYYLHRIDNAIFTAAVNYFQSINADWCNLPLTTLMISSPGEVYAGKTIDYTTDALPVQLSWFDSGRSIFLSESSQFYLELRLLIENINQVFSIYNSFRKEKSDFSHLTEFQHIEYEGRCSLQECVKVYTGLIKSIVKYVVDNERESLEYFISGQEIDTLLGFFEDSAISKLTFEEALEKLYLNTNDNRYKEFSLKNFGSWEEIKLTEIVGGHVLITEFPVMEIPFYHSELKKNVNGISLAENADFILSGYREVVGSGVRIKDRNILLQKAQQFNLPKEDYAPYLLSRDHPGYQKTAGFGLGWQRLVQWMLKLPFIWDATLIPRTHYLPKP